MFYAKWIAWRVVIDVVGILLGLTLYSCSTKQEEAGPSVCERQLEVCKTDLAICRSNYRTTESAWLIR